VTPRKLSRSPLSLMSCRIGVTPLLNPLRSHIHKRGFSAVNLYFIPLQRVLPYFFILLSHTPFCFLPFLSTSVPFSPSLSSDTSMHSLSKPSHQPLGRLRVLRSFWRDPPLKSTPCFFFSLLSLFFLDTS